MNVHLYTLAEQIMTSQKSTIQNPNEIKWVSSECCYTILWSCKEKASCATERFEPKHICPLSAVHACFTCGWEMLGRTSNGPFNEGWIRFSTQRRRPPTAWKCKCNKQFRQWSTSKMPGRMSRQICVMRKSTSFLPLAKCLFELYKLASLLSINAELHQLRAASMSFAPAPRSVTFLFSLYWVAECPFMPLTVHPSHLRSRSTPPTTKHFPLLFRLGNFLQHWLTLAQLFINISDLPLQNPLYVNI